MLAARAAIILLLFLSMAYGAAPHRKRTRARHHHRTVLAHRHAALIAPGKHTFSATAYSKHGRTASGKMTASHTVAADPRVLPLGSKIQISNAGSYSGVYSVQDRGSAVKGRTIDLFLPRLSDARRFGRRQVEVELLSLGQVSAH